MNIKVRAIENGAAMKKYAVAALGDARKDLESMPKLLKVIGIALILSPIPGAAPAVILTLAVWRLCCGKR